MAWLRISTRDKWGQINLDPRSRPGIVMTATEGGPPSLGLFIWIGSSYRDR